MRLALLLTLIINSHIIVSQTVTQWRGNDRSGVYQEKGLMKKWQEKGPEQLWVAKGIGAGYSSVVVDKNGIYTTGKFDSLDFMIAINLKGEIKWKTPIGNSWYDNYADSRSTPCLDNGLLYAISGGGQIACINSIDGSVVWTYDAIKRFEGVWGSWGVCESLLIVGEKLIYTPAGPKTTMVALNKKNGETIWLSESLNDTSAYVSPLYFEHNQKKIITTLISNYLIGVDADNGNILWKYKYSELKPEEGLKIWPGAPKTNTNTPLYHNGQLFITGGYNHVSVLFQLDEKGENITMLWEDSTLDCHHGGVVQIDGYIYGSNWINNSKGNWCCIDWKTGKTQWEEKWQTKGSIIANDGMLYCYEEKNGNIALVKANPEKFELISSFRINEGTGPHWAHPVINDGILYIRHGNAVIAYNIKNK